MHGKWQKYKPETLHSKPYYYEVSSEELLIQFKGMFCHSVTSILHLPVLNPLGVYKPLEVRVLIFLISSTELSPAAARGHRAYSEGTCELLLMCGLFEMSIEAPDLVLWVTGGICISWVVTVESACFLPSPN